jgi:hypothetical protein
MTDNAAEHAASTQPDTQSTGYRPADMPAVTRPMESTGFATSDPSALADLQLHWGGAYEIGLDGDIWWATFRGTTDQLRAHTCAELRVLVRADYAYRQQAGPARRASSANGPGGVIRGERDSL